MPRAKDLAISGDSQVAVVESTWLTPQILIGTVLMLVAIRIAIRLVDSAIDYALTRTIALFCSMTAKGLRRIADGFDYVAEFCTPRTATTPTVATTTTTTTTPLRRPQPKAGSSDAPQGLRTPPPTPEDVRRPSLPERVIGYGKHSDFTYARAVREQPSYCQWTVDHDGPSRRPEFRLFAAFCRMQGFQPRRSTTRQPNFDLGGAGGHNDDNNDSDGS